MAGDGIYDPQKEVRKDAVVVRIATAVELILLLLRVVADMDRVVCAD
jgi:hypothetical protein